MYVSGVVLSSRATVAWQIGDDWRQSPLNGHVIFCRQLQDLVSFVLVLSMVSLVSKYTKTYSCQQKNTRLLNGNYLQSSLICRATVTCKHNSTTETYIGLTENDFKSRYRIHTTSFQHKNHRNSTELSKHIWTLKESNIGHSNLWHILSPRSPYKNASKRCNLCLKEKLLIIHQPELSLVNKRNEHVYSGHYRNKQLLCNN